eukprot:5018611-Alexandrium_andersonii.AAC.1
MHRHVRRKPHPWDSALSKQFWVFSSGLERLWEPIVWHVCPPCASSIVCVALHVKLGSNTPRRKD